ncbi:MAG: sulfotransferase [Candidatus Marithrix sp.]
MQPYKLPLSFDPIQLTKELEQFNSTEWHSTANESAIILSSVGGTINWDFAISGSLKPTIFLERCSYVKQILNSLAIPVSRCRFTKFTIEQLNYNYHQFRHIIIYLPVLTKSTLSYKDNNIKMVPGEAWIFANKKPYHIDPNNSLLAIEIPRVSQYNTLPHKNISYLTNYSESVNLTTYQFEILRPSEIQQLTTTILAEVKTTQIPAFENLVQTIEAFNKQWQVEFVKFGHNSIGELAYQDLISYFSKQIIPKVRKWLSPQGNGNYAINIISSMLLTTPPQPKRLSRNLLTKKRLQVKPTVHLDVAYKSLAKEPNRNLQPNQTDVLKACSSSANLQAIQLNTKLETDEIITIVQKLLTLRLLTEDFQCPKFDQPIFIVSAPRAGSTLLFNTLSLFSDLWTIGEESHELIESIPTLHPSYRNFDSNCLTVTEATADIAITLQQRFVRELQNRDGNSYLNFPIHQRPNKIRFMEKTPKNALRIPFLKTVFPEAIFIYLYRDPKENINSMMEFWRSRRFIAYQPLPGWPYSNWSFLLTPGWKKLMGNSIAEIAAYQWQTANSYIENNLQKLPKSDWCFINYADLIGKPKETIYKISKFAKLNWDSQIEQTLSNPLPISPMTLSAPSPDKWLKHAAEINGAIAKFNLNKDY